MVKSYDERLCLFAGFFAKYSVMPTIEQTEKIGLKKEFYRKFKRALEIKGVYEMERLCLNFLNKRGK
tara:strand:- start:178 stop:378 length:201 start_codon:yes stop_codon:yes gene_type:complete